MRKPIAILAIIIGCCCFWHSRSATVNFNMADFTTGTITNREVQITPMFTPTTNSPDILIMSDRKSYWTSTNGTFSVTNMTPGAYLCAMLGPFTKTQFHICVPDGTNSYSAFELFCDPQIALLNEDGRVLKADP